MKEQANNRRWNIALGMINEIGDFENLTPGDWQRLRQLAA